MKLNVFYRELIKETITDYSKGGIVTFDDCTKLNNNKDAQNGGCSQGVVDDVVKISPISERIIDEAMLGINELPPTVGLFISEFHSGVVFSLFDYENNKTYAMMNIELKESAYNVSAVAAEKGFGPLMYELAMMYVNTKNSTLQPDISGGVKDKAMKIWLQFYDRKDIPKDTLEPTDFEFSYTILGELHPSDPNYKELSYEDKTYSWSHLQQRYGVNQEEGEKILLAYNSVYWMAPNQTYKELIKRAEEAENNGVDPEKALDSGSDYWDRRY